VFIVKGILFWDKNGSLFGTVVVILFSCEGGGHIA
jgi:hypothetical protein